MNTLTPLNPDTVPDSLPENPKVDTLSQSGEMTIDTAEYTSYAMPASEIEQSRAQPETTPSTIVPASTSAPSAFGVGATSTKSMTIITSSGFLMKYIASLFAGISVLSGLSSLGFILLDHFINQPTGVTLGSMFDASTFVSTWHVWLIASLLTFVVLYLALSRAAGKYLADAEASEREIQVAEVARSIFTAVLITSAAYLVASLLFTLLNNTLAAAEVDGKDIAIQVAGCVLAFIWIGVIIKHQSAVHLRGKNGIAGIILAVGAVTIAVLASVFLLAAGRNAVIDGRTISDLSTIQSALTTHKSKNGTYPDNLTQITIDDEKVKGRLAKYTYTRIASDAPSASTQIYDNFSNFKDRTASDSLLSTMNSYSSSQSTKSGYKLCATFLTDASSKESVYGSSAVTSRGSSSTFYAHGKGEHCVERDL